MDVQRPLKALDDINKPDEASQSFNTTLANNHHILSKIILNETCPREVKQLFETAKNVSLYSWYVYHFHQVAETVSFSAVEMALRHRYLEENPTERKSKRPLALYGLLQHAKEHGWLSNEGFPSLEARAIDRAMCKKFEETVNARKHENEAPISIEITEDDIQKSLAEIDLVSGFADNANKIRNNLAHGSTMLTPSSISTLNYHAEVINQVFPE